MAKRKTKTLMDFMVIAISPALIMCLVGSLVFFLLTVFYSGPHQTRLIFIFAMFVMATVCVARIAMEEGKEYAALFGLPLAIVSIIAMMRFVTIEGLWGPLAAVINFGLLGLVWWSSHKLTWDCTLIDENQDSSGQGLLQTMGFDDQHEVGESETANLTDDDESRPSQETADQAPQPKSLWQQFVDHQRRPHAPGVWVIYFSLAALPTFGIGHWFIPVEDEPSRQFAFRMMVIYAGSALGLLLTTSFLGLRRYLRRRNLEMPHEMTGVWLGVGAAVVLMFLLFCSILPRPSAEFAVARTPFSFTSPTHHRPSRWGKGNDGPQDDQMASRTRSDIQEGESAPGQSDQTSASGQAGDKKSGSSSGSKSGGKSGSKSGGKSDSKSSQSQSGSNTSPDRSEQNQYGSQDSQSGSSQKQSGSQESNAQGKSGDSSGKQSSSKQGANDSGGGESNRQTGDQSSGDNSNRGDSPSGDQQPGRDPSDPSADEPQTKGGDGTGGEDNDQNTKGSSAAPRFESSQPSPSKSSGTRSANRSSSPPQRSSGNTLSRLGQGLGVIVKLLFYAALLLIAAWLAWKYREQLRDGWHRLKADLRRLWERWMGRRSSPAEDVPEVTDRGPVLPSFLDFANPFESPQHRRQSNEQLVRYTFEAVQAWGRDRGQPRHDDDTPLEFAAALGNRYPRAARDLHFLAQAYGQLAYAGASLSDDVRPSLQRLWQQLQQDAVPVTAVGS